MAAKKPDADDSTEGDMVEVREAFEACANAEAENRKDALDDLQFARLGGDYQWDPLAIQARIGRPRLTINRMPAIIRQVTNETRQNRPSIKVRPADNYADVHTAEVYNGLIRNIEQMSSADIAYDTAADFAVSMGFGYFRIAIDFAHDDTFDKDLLIQSIENPFTVYGDPHDVGATSRDWNTAFVTEMMPKDEFRRKYKGADEVDWDDLGYSGINTEQTTWCDDDELMIAEWWTRSEVTRKLLRLSNGVIVGEDEFNDNRETFDALGLSVEATRDALSYQVRQRIVTGAEVISDSKWAGRYIPIVPVYGDAVNVQGKRYLRSLIRDAKDPARMHNYWRTIVTELVALQPKAPWVGPEGFTAIEGDGEDKWATANTKNHDYLEYVDGKRPERVPFTGIPAGAMQEALNASDDIKAVTGLYDASLGNRSNETSGKAINARKIEGDTSTFNFIDNLSRGIEHGGRILLDLIPKVYTGQRMVRILGAEGEAQNVQIAQTEAPMIGLPRQQPAPRPMKKDGKPDLSGVFDLGLGKYDLTVEVGPSYTSRRTEAAEQMMQLAQAQPQLAAIAGDLIVKNMDFPGATEIAQRIKASLPANLVGDEQDGIPAPVQQLIEKGKAEIMRLTSENQQLQTSQQADQIKAAADMQKAKTAQQQADTDRYVAETDRMRAESQRMETERNLIATKIQAAAMNIFGAPGAQ